MRCPSCGAPAAESDRFCGSCGTQLVARAAAPRPAAPRPAPPRPGPPPQRASRRHSGPAVAPAAPVAATAPAAPAAQAARPGNWWPSTALGTAFFIIIILPAMGIGGGLAAEKTRNPQASLMIAVISGLTAYSLLTFWRYAFLHWVWTPGPRTPDAAAQAGGGGAAVAPEQQPSLLWRILGFIGVIILVALVRGCGREIVKMLT